MRRHLYALAALLLTCILLAAPAPDPFRSGWGAPLDPDKDCKITRDKSTLTIELPGTDHDYDTARERLNAPRLMRELEGDFEMQIRLRIDSLPSAKSSVKGQPSFVAAGFLVIPSETFFVLFFRFQYGLAVEGNGADGYANHLTRGPQGGSVSGVCDKGWRNWPFKSKPESVYMRLERRDQLLLYRISPDGSSWVTIGGGTYLGLPSKLNVGLAGFSTSTEPSKVRFDQLRLTRGKRNKR